MKRIKNSIKRIWDFLNQEESMRFITDDTELLVTYPDNTAHVLTVRQFIERFKEENYDWLRRRLYELKEKGVTYSSFGKYHVISKKKSDNA